jgi:hypothetical protein
VLVLSVSDNLVSTEHPRLFVLQNVNAANREGNTPLHWASLNHHVQVRLFIDCPPHPLRVTPLTTTAFCSRLCRSCREHVRSNGSMHDGFCCQFRAGRGGQKSIGLCLTVRGKWSETHCYSSHLRRSGGSTTTRRQQLGANSP